jgi:DnaJ-class molecular chaperone
MTPATDNRRDDTATAPREVPCPYCEGKGEVVSRFTSSIDPNAVRTFYQRCYQCGGSGKATAQ